MSYTVHRIVMILFWLLIVANQFANFSRLIFISLNLIAAIFFVMHLVEFFVLKELIDHRRDGKLYSFFMTLLFGLYYWKSPISRIETEGE